MRHYYVSSVDVILLGVKLILTSSGLRDVFMKLSASKRILYSLSTCLEAILVTTPYCQIVPTKETRIFLKRCLDLQRPPLIPK